MENWEKVKLILHIIWLDLNRYWYYDIKEENLSDLWHQISMHTIQLDCPDLDLKYTLLN